MRPEESLRSLFLMLQVLLTTNFCQAQSKFICGVEKYSFYSDIRLFFKPFQSFSPLNRTEFKILNIPETQWKNPLNIKRYLLGFGSFDGCGIMVVCAEDREMIHKFYNSFGQISKSNETRDNWTTSFTCTCITPQLMNTFPPGVSLRAVTANYVRFN